MQINDKTDYLYSILDKLDHLESFIENGKFKIEDISEIFKIIHSIKGTAASMEFYFISTLAHDIEDHLTLIQDEKEQIDDQYMQVFDRLIDLLLNVTNDYLKNDISKFPLYRNMLSKLIQVKNNSQREYQGNILVVNSSPAMNIMIKNQLLNSGFNVSFAENGLSAFNQIILNKFDAVLSSYDLEIFDAIILMNLVRNSKCNNSNIPFVLMTSHQNMKTDIENCYILQKGQDFFNDLNKVLKQVFNTIDELKAHDFHYQNILYIEDTIEMQKLVQFGFSKYTNANIHIAENGYQAQLLIEKYPIDLILIDQYLEQENGRDIFKLIAHHKIPCVFVTATLSSLNLSELFQYENFKGVVTKPFRPTGLVSSIMKVIS